MTSSGVCRQCETRKPDLVIASRTGGGSYRRAPRQYKSSICLACARELLARAPAHAMATVDRWSVSSLRRAVERAEQKGS
jgi:hypothetical protein